MIIKKNIYTNILQQKFENKMYFFKTCFFLKSSMSVQAVMITTRT